MVYESPIPSNIGVNNNVFLVDFCSFIAICKL